MAFSNLDSLHPLYIKVHKMNDSHEAKMFDLKMRLAVRIAANITDDLKLVLQAEYTADQLNLIFDSLADGLGGRTEDELLSLIRTGAGGIYGE